jgi:acetoin utilization protein AcuC
MRVCVYDGEELARYGFGHGHPFGPDRLAAFRAELKRQGLDRRVALLPPVLATGAEVARFHTTDHIARVQAMSLLGEGYLDHGDTPAFPGMYEATCYVVGSLLDAVARVVDGRCGRGFVPIAGLHHARRDGAAGFCVFNDIGVAIETLRQVHGIQRIAYVDIDAHHGDGVFYAFEDDPHLAIADLHEDGRYLYPGSGRLDETGRGDARGSKLNIPLPPGADDALFRRLWPPVEDLVRAAKPEIILLQAGADSIAGDPLTHLDLSPASHGYATQRLCRLADELCDGRLVATGGGGYDRGNLARTWCAVVDAMLTAS